MSEAEKKTDIGKENLKVSGDSISEKTKALHSSIIDSLTGQQKVAALLVAMGKPAAARLLKHFSPDDLRRLTGQAHTLPDISLSDFEVLVREFEDKFAEGVSFSQAGERFENLVLETLPEDEAAAVLDPSSTPALPMESIWDIMARLSPEDLQGHLTGEHPQVVAYIFSKLPSDIAAKILLEENMAVRSDIIKRSLHLRNVQPAADELLESALRPLLTKETAVEEKSHYGQVATILNQLDKSEIDEMLSSLEGISPEDLAAIKSKLFVFDDIPRLSERARLLLFDDIPADTIIMALRGADAQMSELILSSLSQRSRRMVEGELATPNDQISQTDISNARRAIAQAAIQLAEQGSISLAGEEEGAA